MKKVADITLTEMQAGAGEDNLAQMIEMMRHLGSIKGAYDLSAHLNQVIWNRANEHQRLGFIVAWLANERARQEAT